MCDFKCWGATTSPSHCQCECHGINHGRGASYSRALRSVGPGVSQSYIRRMRRRIYSYHEPTLTIQQQVPRFPTVGHFFASMGRSMVTSAVIYGLSAAVPPFGAVAIPAYTAYGYLTLGQGMFKAYEELQANGTISSNTIRDTSGSAVETFSGPAADTVAGAIVSRAQQSGVFGDIAQMTGVSPLVYQEMFKGSASSALSSSSGELAKFVVRKAVGA
jgi:hypothetical protein